MRPSKLSENLRARRVAAGLSQNDVAEKLGVAQPTISNWELGRSQPSAPQVTALEGILGSLETPLDTPGSTGPTEASPFGVWLNAARTRRGLTVVELAGKAGVSLGTIYNLESGRIENPQKATRDKVIKALGETPPAEAVEATEAASAIEGLGNLVDFDPHDDGSLPEGPGVYVFYDISDRPVYVGESGDMRSRIRGHTDKFWFKRPIVEYGSYIVIQDNDLRRQVERVLIRFLKSNAVLNKQHVERDDSDSPRKPNRR